MDKQSLYMILVVKKLSKIPYNRNIFKLNKTKIIAYTKVKMNIILSFRIFMKALFTKQTHLRTQELRILHQLLEKELNPQNIRLGLHFINSILIITMMRLAFKVHNNSNMSYSLLIEMNSAQANHHSKNQKVHNLKEFMMICLQSKSSKMNA
jgi:hypothetical protein